MHCDKMAHWLKVSVCDAKDVGSVLHWNDCCDVGTMSKSFAPTVALCLRCCVTGEWWPFGRRTMALSLWNMDLVLCKRDIVDRMNEVDSMIEWMMENSDRTVFIRVYIRRSYYELYKNYWKSVKILHLQYITTRGGLTMLAFGQCPPAGLKW